MNSYKLVSLVSLIMLVHSLSGQLPEKQVSFARVPKPHSYYIKQAELWWKEIEKDNSNEGSWYNYFRANRNAQATAGWNKDFIKESPYLMSGPDIVKLLDKHIPGTFVYNYVIWSERGFDPSKGPYLLKAYEMNPDFEGIHSTMIAYTDCIFDFSRRSEVNNRWFLRNEMSPGLLAYGYNVLMSIEPNGIIFTQHDNDTFPLWMLQDVKHIRPDITVINFDMLLVKSYRERLFKKYKIKQLDKVFEESNPDNLKTILNHILISYEGTRPIHLGLSVTPEYYEKYSDRLFTCGLTLKYSDKPEDISKNNLQLFENRFLLDYLKIQMANDLNQYNVNILNLNYLKCLKIIYNVYISDNDLIKAARIKDLATMIVQNAGGKNMEGTLSRDFN